MALLIISELLMSIILRSKHCMKLPQISGIHLLSNIRVEATDVEGTFKKMPKLQRKLGIGKKAQMTLQI